MEKMGLSGPKPDLRKDPKLEMSGFERFNMSAPMMEQNNF